MKKTKQKRGVNPVVAAAVGAAVAAGAIALSDEDNQKKIKGAFTKAKDRVTGCIEDEKEMVEEKIAEGKSKTNRTAKTVKEAKSKIKSIWQK